MSKKMFSQLQKNHRKLNIQGQSNYWIIDGVNDASLHSVLFVSLFGSFSGFKNSCV